MVGINLSPFLIDIDSKYNNKEVNMLTPADIENKVFKKAKIGGYDINDVEDFLEKLIVDYEAVFKIGSPKRTCLWS